MKHKTEWVFTALIVGFVILMAFVVYNLERTGTEYSEPLKASAVFLEATHKAQTVGTKVGYHLTFRGKYQFGPYIGTIKEKNSTTFRLLDTEEQFTTSDREICLKFVSIQKGTEVNLEYQRIYNVVYDGDKVVRKTPDGIKVLNATPKK